MLFCDINDAFNNNINSNYIDKFNINSINNNSVNNDSTYNLHENNHSQHTDANSMHKFIYSELNNQNQEQKQHSNIILPKKSRNTPQLTHRECILIYLNPDKTSNENVKNAALHIKKCPLCKNEIRKQLMQTKQKTMNNPNVIKKTNIIKTAPVENIKLEDLDDNDEYKMIIQKQNNKIAHLYTILEQTTCDAYRNPVLIAIVVVGLILLFDIVVRLKRNNY